MRLEMGTGGGRLQEQEQSREPIGNQWKCFSNTILNPWRRKPRMGLRRRRMRGRAWLCMQIIEHRSPKSVAQNSGAEQGRRSLSATTRRSRTLDLEGRLKVRGVGGADE